MTTFRHLTTTVSLCTSGDIHLASCMSIRFVGLFTVKTSLTYRVQSPARGGKLHLDEDVVYAYYMFTQKWDRATVKSQIIDVYNVKDVSNYSELDLHSVMMYPTSCTVSIHFHSLPTIQVFHARCHEP